MDPVTPLKVKMYETREKRPEKMNGKLIVRTLCFPRCDTHTSVGVKRTLVEKTPKIF